MQPKQQGSGGDGEASAVMADLKSMIQDQFDHAAAEEPELLLVHPQGPDQPQLSPPFQAASESLARSRARIERVLSSSASITAAAPEPTPVSDDQAERPRRTFSTGSERLRLRTDAQAPPSPVAAAAIAVEPAVVRRTNVEPVAAAPVAAEPVAAEPVAAEPIAATPLPEAPRASTPVEIDPVSESPTPPPATEAVRPTFDHGPGPAPASPKRMEIKREPRLTDSVAAGLRQAHREIEDLIVANRSAYVHLFGAADLPDRPKDQTTPLGAAANGHLIGALSELERSVAELAVLFDMMLPRI